MRNILRFSTLAFAAASFALVTMPASAADVISVPPFKAIALHGGGHVTIHHGNTQRVTMIEGDRNVAKFKVDSDGTLNLSPCEGVCWGSHRLSVEIVTPAIAGVSIHGGGKIEADGAFPEQPSLNVAIHGGGKIDLRAIAANQVNAAVHGGGKIAVDAENQINAAVHGGGNITYWGHPQVSTSIHGGGTVNSGS